MPRKKQTKERKLSVGDWILTAENLKKENDMLRKQADLMSERYNFVNQEQTQPKSFLTKESQRQITATHDLQQFVTEVYSKGIEIIGRKNRDYGDHKNSDPFGNFNRHGLKGFLVRIDDKLARLNTFCDSGRLTVIDESVLDTIIDAANYLAIMAAYIYSKNLSSSPETFKLENNYKQAISDGFSEQPR